MPNLIVNRDYGNGQPGTMTNYGSKFPGFGNLGDPRFQTSPAYPRPTLPTGNPSANFLDSLSPEMKARLMPGWGGGATQPGVSQPAYNLMQRQMQRIPSGWGGGSTGFTTGGQYGGGYGGTPAGRPTDAWGNPLQSQPMNWADIARGRFAPMPQFLTPSAQYYNQMGPTAQQQYQGYAQATMGWLPEESLWRQRMIAPPGGQPINVNWR